MLSNKKGTLKVPFLFMFMKEFLNNIDLIIGQH